jgi:hypothetical protein
MSVDGAWIGDRDPDDHVPDGAWGSPRQEAVRARMLCEYVTVEHMNARLECAARIVEGYNTKASKYATLDVRSKAAQIRALKKT